MGKQGIGRNRSAMKDMLNLATVRPGHLAKRLNPLHHADRRIFYGRRYLMNPGLLLGQICQDQIGKSSTNINADQLHSRILLSFRSV